MLISMGKIILTQVCKYTLKKKHQLQEVLTLFESENIMRVVHVLFSNFSRTT